MLHTLILKFTKFQLPPPERLSTVVKNILEGGGGGGGGGIMASCRIGLSQSLLFYSSILIDKKLVYFAKMSQCEFDKVKDLLDQKNSGEETPLNVYLKYTVKIYTIARNYSQQLEVSY